MKIQLPPAGVIPDFHFCLIVFEFARPEVGIAPNCEIVPGPAEPGHPLAVAGRFQNPGLIHEL